MAEEINFDDEAPKPIINVSDAIIAIEIYTGMTRKELTGKYSLYGDKFKTSLEEWKVEGILEPTMEELKVVFDNYKYDYLAIELKEEKRKEILQLLKDSDYTQLSDFPYPDDADIWRNYRELLRNDYSALNEMKYTEIINYTLPNKPFEE